VLVLGYRLLGLDGGRPRAVLVRLALAQEREIHFRRRDLAELVSGLRRALGMGVGARVAEVTPPRAMWPWMTAMRWPTAGRPRSSSDARSQADPAARRIRVGYGEGKRRPPARRPLAGVQIGAKA
jgi:hypothetical protein